MADYGRWEGRPWQGGEDGRAWDRWRREQEERGRTDEPWRDRLDEGMGVGGHEPWRDRGEERRLGATSRGRRRGEWGDERSPWRESPQGLLEVEDRGPLAWLREKAARRRGKPLRGPKGYVRSDERIQDDVCERIACSGVDADDVEVKVENREVTLSGTVPTREEKWWLEYVVEDAFGVEDVHNRLRVARPAGQGASQASARADEDLSH